MAKTKKTFGLKPIGYFIKMYYEVHGQSFEKVKNKINEQNK